MIALTSSTVVVGAYLAAALFPGPADTVAGVAALGIVLIWAVSLVRAAVRRRSGRAYAVSAAD